MRSGKTYENTTILMHSLKLSKTFQGQEELGLSKEVAEAMMAQLHIFLSTCIVSYDDVAEKYYIAMPDSGQEVEETLSSQAEPTSRMEQQKAIFPNAYSPWSEEDDQRLRQLFQEGKSVNELMTIFQRNRGSITSRLRKLGLMD